MPRTRTLLLIALCLCVAAASAARTPTHPTAEPVPVRVGDQPGDLSPQKRALFAKPPVDTFVLGEFSFDAGGAPDAEGWYGADLTIKYDSAWHVADAGQLYGGDFGRLIVLEGNQSLWCGTNYNLDPEVCSYAVLPGYGNSWYQVLRSQDFSPIGDVTIDFLMSYDSEPGYDGTRIRVLNDNGMMTDIDMSPFNFHIDGQGIEFASFDVPDSLMAPSTRIEFVFSSDGAFSDEDGLWPTDGGIIIDSLSVTDASGQINFQDFEAEPVGARMTNDGWWTATNDGYGMYADIFSGMSLAQDDPCVSNLTHVWGFFSGSTYDYTCGGHPGQAVVPYEKADNPYVGRYLWNEIWSPQLDLSMDVNGAPVPAGLTRALLEFDVYRDLNLDALVFYTWRMRNVTAGCVGTWDYDNYVYYANTKDWYRHRQEIGGWIEPTADAIQVALGGRDMCGIWCGSIGTGSCHSHGPLFDNVRVSRLDVAGPAFSVQFNSDAMFQDGFPSDGTTTGVVEMLTGTRDPEVSLWVVSPINMDENIPGNQGSGPAVYAYVKDVSGPKSGSVLAPGYNYLGTGAPGWSKFQMSGFIGVNDAQAFTFALNSALFTPGDVIYYYFSARDTSGATTYWSLNTGNVTDEAQVLAAPMEVSCLPINAPGGTDILYVDNFDNRGAQPIFETAFDALGITPDRYDVLNQTPADGSGLGNRVFDVLTQLGVYKKIIWNSGTLLSTTIGDGAGLEEADDFSVLYQFLDQGTNGPGIYFSGDGLASEWAASSVGDPLRTTYMDFTVLSDDHFALGEPVSPLVIAEPGSCFDNGSLDSLIAWGGGCGAVNNFDVLTPHGSAAVEMSYSGNPSYGAVLSQVTPNAVGDTARVMLSGFSYHLIRDDRVSDPMDRVDHLRDILAWLGNATVPTGAGDDLPQRDALAQNYPNPFNPSTTIRFQLRQSGNVTLRIYDVAGRLVKTLVDGARSAGVEHAVHWNGTNSAGQRVASGVYFYRIAAGDFSATKKMVLLE